MERMKTGLYLLCFLLLAGCQMTEEQDYANMADDICECMNKAVKDESDYNNCITYIENKYENLYSDESDEEFNKKLVEAMKKNTKCDAWVGFLEMGMENQQ